MGKIRSTNSEALRAVFTVSPDADRVLGNWGRWAGSRGSRGQTNVMFRMMKSSFARGAEVLPCSVPVDVESACTAEKVICARDFYTRARSVLTLHYVYSVDQRQTCRTLGLHVSAYEEELWRSACMFWNCYQQRMPHGLSA